MIVLGSIYTNYAYIKITGTQLFLLKQTWALYGPRAGFGPPTISDWPAQRWERGVARAETHALAPLLSG